MPTILITLPVSVLLVLPVTLGAAEGTVLDHLVFGDPASEQRHGVAVTGAETITGGLGQTARRLLPRDPADWQGGSLRFTLAVDPGLPTYATVRFWGSEGSPDRLFLFVDGKQVGYRHLGDIDILDVGAHEPPCNGRFYYVTTPLPLAVTQGRTSVACEIRATGPIWGYGQTFDKYQKPMTEPTRGIYAIASHTEGCYVPGPGEIQGACPADPPTRTTPGPEVLDAVKARVSGAVTGLLKGKEPLNQVQTHVLAKAWHVGWTPAFHAPTVVERITASIDRLAEVFARDPGQVRADPAVYNSDWFASGLAADAVRLLAEPLQGVLDQPLPGGGTRRASWAAMFRDSREWLARHRRLYTNQTMIVDMNIYRCNRALAVLDPAQALPEKAALRYLREAIGLDPWLGSDTDQGPAKPMGEQYYQLTAKGLTKELGFVGYYGEVLDWVTQIYDATRMPGQEGDPDIKAQLGKIARARAYFRYPMLDAEGNRAMRIEAVVGWRDDHYPGNVTYGERPTWDASALYAVDATRDPVDVGYAQQMLADHQFFASVVAQSGQNGSLRVTEGLLGIPDQYAAITALPPVAHRLPMTRGGPDLVFSDEEDGVVAVKHGDEILYASLYWRARHAVNNLARIHHITPAFDRVAVVRETTEITPSGLTWKRPDYTDFGFANGGHRYPVELHSAFTGEELPIARIPAGIPYQAGQENAFAGRADFYRCQYGRYLIGLNATQTTTFPLEIPAGAVGAVNLVTGQGVAGGTALAVGPRTTAVILLPGR